MTPPLSLLTAAPGRPCPACAGSGRIAPRAAVMDAMLEAIAARHGVEIEDMFRPNSRVRAQAAAREEFCATAHDHNKSWPQIAAKLGLAHHTSAMAAARRWRRRMAQEDAQ